MILRFLIYFLLTFFSLFSIAKTYKYKELMNIKPYDFLVQVKVQIEKSQKNDIPPALQLELLRETLKRTLSRPDRDNTLIEVMPPLRAALENLSSFGVTLLSLTNGALLVAKNKDLSPEVIATSYFFLENTLSEIRPLLASNKVFMQILMAIHDANIKVNPKAKSYRRLHGIFKTHSPSLLAKKILALNPSKKPTASKR